MACHGAIADIGLHPDPADVNKTIQDFFNAERCGDCHESIDDYIQRGDHGGVKVEKSEDIENCLSCHDPHYELGQRDDAESYDPILPVNRQCGFCHEPQDHLPTMDPGDEACMSCHRLIKPGQPHSLQSIKYFCFHCHGGDNSSGASIPVPLIDTDNYDKTPHADMSCRICHPDSAKFDHANQSLADCRQCHSPHDEKIAHDAHMRVSCEACHLSGVIPKKNAQTGRTDWQINTHEVAPSNIHHMSIDDEESSCRRCHFSGNSVGAASMVLPAKSFICMPCHTATLSADDTITVLSLIVFMLGMLSLLLMLMSGSLGGETEASFGKKLAGILRSVYRILFSSDIVLVFKSLVLDALLQRQLFYRSVSRWVVHGMIFFPFVIRFCWGITALTVSLWLPEWSVTRAMLDKNHPVTAILFDITGIMVMLGVIPALVLKKQRLSGITDLPKQDRAAVSLLGGIILIGFILEGMRIAMTGSPSGASYAFFGYGISCLLTGMTGLNDIYGYLWYAHAALTGLFVAYLPFSRMLHIITAPIVLAMNRIAKERK